MEDDLISHETALDIYKVVIDPQTLVVDEQATTELRASERRSRIARGTPFDEFVQTWSTEEPPASIPYFGCWGKQGEIYGETMGQRVKMSGDALMSMFMLNPKDVKIAALEAENARLRALTGNLKS
jgi:hypothetical protein